MLYHFSLLHNSLSSCFLPLLLFHTVSITIIWLWSWCWRRFCTFGSICLKGLISFFFEPLFSPILFSTLCILALYLFFVFVCFVFRYEVQGNKPQIWRIKIFSTSCFGFNTTSLTGEICISVLKYSLFN